MRLTWLWQVLISWGTASLVFTALCALLLGDSEDIEEEMRAAVLEELREHAWLN